MSENDDHGPTGPIPPRASSDHDGRADGRLDSGAIGGLRHEEEEAVSTPVNPFLVPTPDASPKDDSALFTYQETPAAAWSTDPSASRELIEAVRAIENKSTGGFTKLMVLLASLGVFVAAGMAWWNPRMIGMLVVVLLFHEAGHFIAMKAFGYRNVKMFFIPFLGAAVSGRHFNISGWKKAIVYLAGPVPGIIAAIPLMGLGSAWEIDWMFELGGMSLLLNALNLLPIMPLDGGWIMHLTVFSRSPLLELLARVAGIAAMIAFGVWAGSKFLFFIAIPLLISLPTTFRVSKLIRHLRDEPLPQPESDEIPDGAILRLNEEMQSSALSDVPPPQKAGLLLQIYESLIVRPPGLIATLAIWFMYVGSFFIAAVGGTTMFAMRELLSGGFFDSEMFDSVAHQVPLDPEDTEFSLGSERLKASYLAVARFDSTRELDASFKKIDQQDRQRFTHLRIGDVLLASIPRDDQPDAKAEFADDELNEEDDFDTTAFRERMNEMFRPVDPADTWLVPMVPPPESGSPQSSSTSDDDASTAQPSPGMPIFHVISGMHHDSVQLICRAPSIEIANEVTANDFQMPGLTADRLYIPNWSPMDPPTPRQLANRDILKTLVNGISSESSPKLFELRNKLYEAQYKDYEQSLDGTEGLSSPASRAAKFQSKIRELEAKFTADVIAGLTGEQEKVARRYQQFQLALQAHAKLLSEHSIEMERQQIELGDDFDYEAFEDEMVESDNYPTMDQFLVDDEGLLGFGDPIRDSFAFAAHVSGQVLTEQQYRQQLDQDVFINEDEGVNADDQTEQPGTEQAIHETAAVTDLDEQGNTSGEPYVNRPDPYVMGKYVALYLHRATDFTATVSAVVAYLQRLGFDEFSLHYVTPTSSYE